MVFIPPYWQAGIIWKEKFYIHSNSRSQVHTPWRGANVLKTLLDPKSNTASSKIHINECAIESVRVGVCVAFFKER